jgi:hypothetical protein
MSPFAAVAWLLTAPMAGCELVTFGCSIAIPESLTLSSVGRTHEFMYDHYNSTRLGIGDGMDSLESHLYL